MRIITIDSSRDGDDDDVDPMDVGDSTLKSDELSSSVDAADMSTPVDRLENEDKYTTTSSRAAEKKRLQKQQKVKLLQQNSIEFLSIEHARNRPRDGLSDSNPPARSLSKILRRRSDSTLVSSGVGRSVAASSSCVALNTTLALEDLEREIDALKAKESLLQGNVASFSAVDRKAKSMDDCRQRGLKSSSRREAKILLVSSSALPTQFYDSANTRSVLRTYLTSSGLEFDEMIEYGFPSEAFMNDDDDDSNTSSEDPSSSQQKAAAELTPSCRFLTLRITLTPWHARADESTIYGPRTTMGRQLQFKAMVNKFFSRSGNTTTTVMMGTPLSSPSSLTKPRTLATSVSMSALDAAGSGTFSASRDISTSRPPSRAAESRNTSRANSRANSRASSPRRDKSSPPSSYRGNPAATTDHPSQTYGFSPPLRRPSDQSDTVSTSLASARGFNHSGSGAGYLREKASFDTEHQNRRQHPRYPHSIHIKQQQQQQQTASSSPSTPPFPCPSSNSGSSRSRQGSHSRPSIFDYHQQQQQQQQHPMSLPFSEQGSEEQIYECYHVTGLDNIYRNSTSRAQPTAEKRIHPLQDVPHQSSQQHQHQHSARHGTKVFHFSARHDGKGGDEGRGGQLSSSAMPGGAAEQTPLSAAPPRIQAKNQRRRNGSSCDGSSTTTSRNGPTGAADRDRVRRQNYANVTTRREEEEMNECRVHVGDHSFDGAPPVDGLEDLDEEEEAKTAAARIEGYWRPIECHQTSTMKTFAFP
ncbi:hypothetical protein BGX30_010335 [Mortierella sp. GBA39]|nr:hypothetical protein BGX30_010335 [Mortierella sp. GBA39]